MARLYGALLDTLGYNVRIGCKKDIFHSRLSTKMQRYYLTGIVCNDPIDNNICRRFDGPRTVRGARGGYARWRKLKNDKFLYVMSRALVTHPRRASVKAQQVALCKPPHIL